MYFYRFYIVLELFLLFAFMSDLCKWGKQKFELFIRKGNNGRGDGFLISNGSGGKWVRYSKNSGHKMKDESFKHNLQNWRLTKWFIRVCVQTMTECLLNNSVATHPTLNPRTHTKRNSGMATHLKGG